MNDRAMSVEDFDDDDEQHEAVSAASSEPEVVSAAHKNRIREQLQSDIEAFLARGGLVQQVADNVRADPPRKPDSQYGANPI